MHARVLAEPARELARGLRLPLDAEPRASRGCGAGASTRRAPRRCRSSSRNSCRRAASSSRLHTTAPSSTSSWPPRYFVALWRTKSAPCSSGRRWTGVAAVASTTTGAGMRGGGLEVGHRQERVRRRLEPDELHAVRRRARLVELDDARAPSARARRRAGRCRSTRPRRARSSRRARAARARAPSSRRCPTGRAARARPRARRAPARPRRRSGGRSASSRTRAARRARRTARSSSGRGSRTTHSIRRLK